MKHYLTFKDDKSDKFWQIEVAGKSFTVTYGRTGTAGTSQAREFHTKEQCLKEAGKLLNEKLKKGYTEQSPKDKKDNSAGHLDYFKDWQAIAEAKDLHQALANHFTYLADTPDFEPVLKAVVTTAERIDVNEQRMKIQFKGKVTLEAFPPAVNISKRYPTTYKTVVAKHQKLSLNGEIIIGEHGFFEPEWLDEVESELLEIIDPEKIISPLWFGSDCWLYHPKEKNAFGEPVLYFLSHEGGDIERPQPFNIGGFFLSKLAERLKLKIELPVFREKPAKNTSATSEDWQKKIQVLYDGVKRHGKNEEKPLPDAKKLIEMLPKIKSLRFENLSSVKSIPFEKMGALEELMVFCPVYGKKTPLMSLEGIERASELKELQLFGHKLTDISSLATLNKLVRIDLACNKLKDISILKNLRQLEEIELENNPIRDVAPLMGLPKLKNLNLQTTNVEDVNCLIGLKSLKYLTLPKLEKSKIEAFKKARPDVELL